MSPNIRRNNLNNKPEYEQLYEIIKVAKGQKPAEIVIKNAEIVNVFTGAFEIADIAIQDGVIAGVGRYKGEYERDVQRSIVVPGFIDAHMHIETSLLRPEELATELIKHGTTTAIVDPHEIANIAGLTGVDYLLEATHDVPIDFFFTAPSSVPSTEHDIETTGASIGREEIAMLLSDRRVLGLSEVMDISGIMAGRKLTLDKIIVASDHPIDGHAPQLKEKILNAYIASGPTSDHEATSLAEAMEKIGRGMFLMIREGSAAKNLDALLPAVNYITSRNMALVTDDRSLTDIVEEGHIDHLVRRSIAKGLDIRLVVQMVTLNPAQQFGLKDRGAIAPGRIADLLVLEDVTNACIRTVIKNGSIVYDIGQDLQFVERYEPPIILMNTISVTYVSPEDLKLVSEGRKARVIRIIPDEIITDEEIVRVISPNGEVVSDPDNDILKIAVINRYNHDVKIAIGLLKGLGLKSGAICSSVAHDAHNIVAAGANDSDLAIAINSIIEMQGGLIVINNGEKIASLPLRIAGLVSEDSKSDVYMKLKTINEKVSNLGCKLSDPFMTLSYLTLATVPKLKITDRGLIDTIESKRVPLFVPYTLMLFVFTIFLNYSFTYI
jgi:adenine deaminase